MRTGRHKLIVHEDGDDELYDLSEDPGELANLVSRDPDRYAQMRERFRESEAPHADTPTLSQPKQLTAEQEEGLRALGYIE